MVSLFLAGLMAAAPEATVQVADFTDCLRSPAVAALSFKAPKTRGTLGQGIHLANDATANGLRLNPAEGTIAVWVQPSWAGSDGKTHLIWKTNKVDGYDIRLEKSARGLLRAVISTPQGATVARASVANWKPGEQHHVVFGWLSRDGRNVGVALWVDKKAVDGPVTPYGVFNAEAMPTQLTLGGGCAYDELIIRPSLQADSKHGMVGTVYRDYFRSAPYRALRIAPGATQTPTDARAVAGFEKQLGLEALNQGKWERLIENVVRYGQWGYFDGRPFSSWQSSDTSVAQVDGTGRVKAIKPGRCTITAKYQDLRAAYDLVVVSPNQPDLGVIAIDLSPKLRSDAVKCHYAPGETLTATLRFGNFGLKTLPAGAEVRFGLAREVKDDYRFGAEDKPATIYSGKIGRALKPGEEASIVVKFKYPRAKSWMVFELDPQNAVSEVCEANNRIAELADARPIHMGYNPAQLKSGYTKRELNHVGSFSYYDWIRAEKLRMDEMLREAVYPTTGPNGVEESFRIDKFTALVGGNWDDEPYNKESVYFDGGFPVNEPVDLMAIDCAIIHELGHCVLSQPDLYGYPVRAYNVLITDDEGKPVAGSPELPVIHGNELAASPGVNIASYVGYPSLMDGCQLWLEPSQAGHVQFFKGYRQDRFWGTQGRLIPTRANWLMLKDIDDRPLVNAAVYVYHVSQAPVQDSGAKFFADRPKFVGNTDAEGRFTFPGETDADWDDPLTDEVDGAVPVWNPFGTAKRETAFTPNVWEVEGLLLIRIVSNGKTEYQFMDLTQFNKAYLSGDKVLGRYAMQTSLTSSPRPEPIVRKPIPEAIKKVNKAPVAVAPSEMTVRCGEEFVIDGSKSYDPEGQPLLFRWDVAGQWLGATLSQGPTAKLKAPDEPGTKEYKFWVIDGVRSSEAAIVKVTFVK